MFANTYQSGQAVEVFSPAGKDPLKGWKVGTGLRKAYDKALRGFMVQLETQAAQMQIPTSTRLSLGLLQPVLVMQLMIPAEKAFGLEVVVSDHQSRKRRLIFSTNFREVEATELHAKIMLHNIPRNSWMNLVLDLTALVESLYQSSFAKVESFTLKSFCKLRKIFTVNQRPNDSTFADFLPSTHAFPRGFDHQTLVLVANAKTNSAFFRELMPAPLSAPPIAAQKATAPTNAVDRKQLTSAWPQEAPSSQQQSTPEMPALRTSNHSFRNDYYVADGKSNVDFKTSSEDENDNSECADDHSMYIREELMKELQTEQAHLAMLERAFVAEFGLSALQNLGHFERNYSLSTMNF